MVPKTLYVLCKDKEKKYLLMVSQDQKETRSLISQVVTLNLFKNSPIPYPLRNKVYIPFP